MSTIMVQKHISFIFYSTLLLCYATISCSEEKTFYFCRESHKKDILSIQNTIIKKIRFLQELCLLTAYTTDQPKPEKKDWGTIIRPYNNINSRDNPAVISNDIFNDIKIISYAHEQRANNKKTI